MIQISAPSPLLSNWNSGALERFNADPTRDRWLVGLRDWMRRKSRRRKV